MILFLAILSIYLIFKDEIHPILNLDINMGNGHISRVAVYKGDDPDNISREFCFLYKLDSDI